MELLVTPGQTTAGLGVRVTEDGKTTAATVLVAMQVPLKAFAVYIVVTLGVTAMVEPLIPPGCQK